MPAHSNLPQIIPRALAMPTHKFDLANAEALRLARAERLVELKEKRVVDRTTVAAAASGGGHPPPKPKRRRKTILWQKREILVNMPRRKKEEWLGQLKARRAKAFEEKVRAGVPNAMDVDGEDGWFPAPGESDEEEELVVRRALVQVKAGERVLGEAEEEEALPAGFFQPEILGKLEGDEEEDDERDHEICVLDDMDLD